MFRITSLNSDLSNIGKSFYTGGTVNNSSGSKTLTVPAGKYLIIFGGTTQSSEKSIDMRIDNGSPWTTDYAAILTPSNGAANMVSTERSTIKTYTASHTVTLSYSANWYFVYVQAVRIA